MPLWKRKRCDLVLDKRRGVAGDGHDCGVMSKMQSCKPVCAINGDNATAQMLIEHDEVGIANVVGNIAPRGVENKVGDIGMHLSQGYRHQGCIPRGDLAIEVLSV